MGQTVGIITNGGGIMSNVTGMIVHQNQNISGEMSK